MERPVLGLTQQDMDKLARQREKCEAMPYPELRLRLSALCKLIKVGQSGGATIAPFILAQQRMMNEVYRRRVRQHREENGIAEPEPVCIRLNDVCMNSRSPDLREPGIRRN